MRLPVWLLWSDLRVRREGHYVRVYMDVQCGSVQKAKLLVRLMGFGRQRRGTVRMQGDGLVQWLRASGAGAALVAAAEEVNAAWERTGQELSPGEVERREAALARLQQAYAGAVRQCAEGV